MGAHRRRGTIGVALPQGGDDLRVVALIFLAPGGRGAAALQVAPHLPVPGPLDLGVQADQQRAVGRGDDRPVQRAVPDLELVVLVRRVTAAQAAVHLGEVAVGGPGHHQRHRVRLEHAPDQHHVGRGVVRRIRRRNVLRAVPVTQERAAADLPGYASFGLQHGHGVPDRRPGDAQIDG